MVSGIHFMHPDLFINGAENHQPFIKAREHKALLDYSARIFDQVVEELENIEKPDLVLIPGDLTKDAEVINHEAVIKRLNKLKNKSGMKIFVLPGNCDINSNEAKRFDGSGVQVLQGHHAVCDENSFQAYYKAFGYADPGKGDIVSSGWPSSFSYLARPYPHVWILAIDAVKNFHLVMSPNKRGGEIPPARMQWIQNLFTSVIPKGDIVLGMMHHNLVEHLPGHTRILPHTIVANWQNTANDLMDAGLRVIFTGYNHAQDITARDWNGHTLEDIQTGSLVTPPCPYRIINLDLVNQTMTVTTRKVTFLPGVPNFELFARDRLKEVLDHWFVNTYTAGSLLTPQQAAATAPVFRNAFMAHIWGDEAITPQDQADIQALNNLNLPPQLGIIQTISSFWQDVNTKDNDIAGVSVQ